MTGDDLLSLAEQERGFSVNGTGTAGATIVLNWSGPEGALADPVRGPVGTDGRWSIGMSQAALGKVTSVPRATLVVQHTTATGVLELTRTISVEQRQTTSPTPVPLDPVPCCILVAGEGVRAAGR